MREKVCHLWTMSKSNCTCIGEQVVRPSPGDADQNCPYCLCDEHGDEVDQVAERCENEDCTALVFWKNKTLQRLDVRSCERSWQPYEHFLGSSENKA